MSLTSQEEIGRAGRVGRGCYEEKGLVEFKLELHYIRRLVLCQFVNGSTTNKRIFRAYNIDVCVIFGSYECYNKRFRPCILRNTDTTRVKSLFFYLQHNADVTVVRNWQFVARYDVKAGTKFLVMAHWWLEQVLTSSCTVHWARARRWTVHTALALKSCPLFCNISITLTFWTEFKKR